MSARVLFDSSALLAYFKNEPVARSLHPLMERVDKGEVEGLMLVTALMDVFQEYREGQDGTVAMERVDMILHSKLHLVDVSLEMIAKAMEFHASSNTSDACITAAAATIFGADIATARRGEYTSLPVSLAPVDA